MDEKIFDRVEKKYLIDQNQYDRLLSVLKNHMQKDRYYQSEVFNIYFDTDNYDFIIQSIDRPVFKEKLRARSYGGYDKVFLEIKTKIRGYAYRHDLLEATDGEGENNLGYKRRVLITNKDYTKLITGKKTLPELAKQTIEEGSDLQIAAEIDYLIRRFNLKPQILVYYDRESYKDDHDLRITFDTNLKYRQSNLKFRKIKKDQTLLNSDKCIIMEIKAQGAMPLWLVKVLSAEQIYPQSFSKIGKIYEKLRKEKNV